METAYFYEVRATKVEDGSEVSDQLAMFTWVGLPTIAEAIDYGLNLPRVREKLSTGEYFNPHVKCVGFQAIENRKWA